MEIILAIILGSLFGAALFYAGASNPSKLTAMLRLEYLTLMKIILFAIGLGSTLVSIANLIGLFDTSHFSVKAMNLGVILGGVIFGFGFGWAGTCPGTCVAASSGIGYKKGLAAVLGGLVGAFLFTLTYGWWKKTGLFDIWDCGRITLFEISSKYKYLLPGSYWGLLIVGVIFMIISFFIPDSVHS